MNVRTLCLALLSLGEATGYEIMKRLEGPLHHIYEASFGSIYPALNRLTEEGLVTCTALNQDKRPDKKVYRLTQTGKAALLDELTAEVPGSDRIRSDFLLSMLFADLMPPAFVERAIERRQDIYRALLADLEQCSAEWASTTGPASEFVRGYGRAVIRAALAYIDENRHLVEGAALLREDAPAAAPIRRRANAAE